MDQLILLVFGLLCVFFLSCKDIKYMKYGFICGIVAQPLWIYSTYLTGQWGMMILSFFHAALYSRGLVNYYRRINEDSSRN